MIGKSFMIQVPGAVFRNLEMGPISKSIFSWQAFPAWSVFIGPQDLYNL